MSDALSAFRIHALAAALLLPLQSMGQSVAISFWVWHRPAALTRSEATTLSESRIRALYWQLGELRNLDTRWQWTLRYPSIPPVPGIQVIPVIRLVSAQGSPFANPSVTTLLSALSTSGSDNLQLDFDCPDRLLPDYAAFLQKIHTPSRTLGITALAGWPHTSAWSAIISSVDELTPMFYDLDPDPTNNPQPLLELNKFEAQLAAWTPCKTEWRAGLPAFARLTLYDQAGHSLGHIRNWNWDDVCFNTALATTGSTQLGVTLFRVLTPGRIGDVPLQKGQTLAARWTDLDALRQAMAAVNKSPAAGAVFFRMPNSTDPAGWSLTQLLHLDAGPHLLLKASASQQLELCDDADGDLPPRLSGTGQWDRGYSLELDAHAPIFREALGGDFWRVTSHANPDTAPAPAPIPLATRLTFWFSHLRARETLHTGLIQLAPGADFSQVRYRILNAPGDNAWKQIE